MAETFLGRVAEGAGNTLLSCGFSAAVGAATAALIPAIGVSPGGAAIFCLTSTGVAGITNTALNILLRLRNDEVGAKFVASVISCGVGIAVGLAVASLVGIPLTLGAGLALTAATLIAALVAGLLIGGGVLIGGFAISSVRHREQP